MNNVAMILQCKYDLSGPNGSKANADCCEEMAITLANALESVDNLCSFTALVALRAGRRRILSKGIPSPLQSAIVAMGSVQALMNLVEHGSEQARRNDFMFDLLFGALADDCRTHGGVRYNPDGNEACCYH